MSNVNGNSKLVVNVYTCTVSIRRSPLGRKIKWSFKTGDLLKEVKFI